MKKNFTVIDEEFTCINCGNVVPKLNYSSRNHCNHCLHSLHVDKNPGDREETCKGLLVPIDFEKYKDTYKIIYKCEKCNMIRKNIMARDDNFDYLVKLSSKGRN